MSKPRTDRLGLSTDLPFAFELFAPPNELVDLVNTYFSIRIETETVDEIIPAYSAQMLLFPSGSAVLRPKGGTEYRTQTVCFSAPLLRATPVTFEGPARILGASLTPLGWQALAHMPADKVNNRLLAGTEVLERTHAERLAALAAEFEANASEAAVFDAMSAILGERRASLNPKHARIVAKVTRWLADDLSPDIAKLYDEADVSERTVQRVTRRFFGVSPFYLAKRYRAIRAAMMLANPQLSQEMRDALVDSYFDQAHMIRDIRRYTGRTPTKLGGGRIAHDTLAPQAHGEAARLLRE